MALAAPLSECAEEEFLQLSLRTAWQCSEYAGHDIRMLIKVYRHAVEHEEAEKYWNIYPT